MPTVTQHNPQRIVVIGAGYAGMLATLRLAGQTRHQPIEITLVNASAAFTERIRLHQLATHQTLPTHRIDRLLRGTGVKFVQGWVTELHPDRRQLTVKTENDVQTLDYDRLVYALGSYVNRDLVPGAAQYAYTLDLASASQLAEVLPSIAAHGGTVAVVGGGLTGIEAATELAERYPALHVKLIARESLGARLSAVGTAYLRRTFERLHIIVHDNVAVQIVESDAVVLQDGSRLPVEACLWAAGFAISSLAREAGIKVNGTGQILVDSWLRSESHPNIYAIGDAASLENALETPIRMACATGEPLGALAADNVAAEIRGAALRPFRFGYLFQCISLGRRDGLVQFVQADDSPRSRIMTGRSALILKEFLCRYALYSIFLERHFPRSYHWIQPKTPQQIGDPLAVAR